MNVARDLALLAKSIQTLANFTVFTKQEEFMMPMNNWIEETKPRVKKFLDDLSSIPSAPVDEVNHHLILILGNFS